MSNFRVLIPYLKYVVMSGSTLGAMSGLYIGLRRTNERIQKQGFSAFDGFIPAAWFVMGAILGGTGLFFPVMWCYDCRTLKK